ncbi:MAG TPA: hypothetical protein PK339_00100 [Flavitalea sp.]|nr:hypothetical protein [Flavitalea sp.]
MSVHSVITGDIVNSTKLPAAVEQKLLENLNGILQPYIFEFYRGDSFQVYLKEAKAALRVALLCRTTALSLDPEENAPLSDIRIGIGLGEVEEPVHTPGSAKGEAFILSGRSFDNLEKSDARLIITTANGLANAGLLVISDYINAIFRELTAKQAEVIFELLKGHTQQETAAKLQKSKSTIHQHVSSGRWNEIARILYHYEQIIEQLS